LNITVQDDDHVDNGSVSYGEADLMDVIVYNVTSLSGYNGRPNSTRTIVNLGSSVQYVAISIRKTADTECKLTLNQLNFKLG